MSTLARLLSSRVKAAVLENLFGPASTELHVRELARRAHLNDATVRQELKRLLGLHIITSRRDGNRLYFRANADHPLFPELRGIVLKTGGLCELLMKALEGADVDAAFVFGSIASALEDATSDVDLFVIGSVTLRALSSRLSDVAMRIGRSINPVVMSADEFGRRRAEGEHFVADVLAAPRIMVIGSAHELERLGGKWVDAPARPKPKGNHRPVRDSGSRPRRRRKS
jgi:DNA-binding transcriptional ArsR family regulator